MRKFITFLMLALISFSALAQDVTLTFTGRDADNRHVRLNRVVVTNYTKGWQKTLVWPDTIMTLRNAAGTIALTESDGFALSQNNPNPFNATTDVHLTVAETGTAALTVTDINGRVVETMCTPPFSCHPCPCGQLCDDRSPER